MVQVSEFLGPEHSSLSIVKQSLLAADHADDHSTGVTTTVLELCLHSPFSLVTTACTRLFELPRGKISLSIHFCAPMIICLLLMAEKFKELPLRYQLFHIKTIQVPVHL